jgi:hypothetical protein
MIPGCSVSEPPLIVKVLPEAVCPYVKIVTLKPSMAERTSFLPSFSNISSVVISSLKTLSMGEGV